VSFGRFWWDFVVGDDWIAALAAGNIAVWWVMPVAVAVVLYVSLRRAIAA
jgi:hypothetical protein